MRNTRILHVCFVATAVRPQSVVTALGKATELNVGRKVLAPYLHFVYTNLFGFPSRITHDEVIMSLRMAGSIDFDGNKVHAQTLREQRFPTFLSFAHDDALIETSVL